MGISNTVAAVPGIAGNLITGLVLEWTGSWQLVFAMPCGLLLFGCAVFCLHAKGEIVLR
jgi:hypothetical protein